MVIALHGTGGNKDSGQIVEILTKATRRPGSSASRSTAGSMASARKAGTGAAEYNEAIARAFKTGEGHPFYYDTVWDVMRLIDYLGRARMSTRNASGSREFRRAASRRISPPRRIRRVAAAVSYIGVQSFKWALDNGQWRARIATIEDGFNAAATQAGKSPRSADFVREFYARVVPGIDGKFDAPVMLALVAPRPLLVINGDSDANTPIAGVRLACAPRSRRMRKRKRRISSS